MSRRYSDRIRVRSFHQEGDEEPDSPQDFVWRGRPYRVLVILARWLEAEQWWRLAGLGSSAAVAESVVWRVEAACRQRSPGVFDLRHRVGEHRSEWFLIRAFD